MWVYCLTSAVKLTMNLPRFSGGMVLSGIKSLRKSLRRYINRCYSMARLHSGIDYLSPMEFERRIA